MAATRVLTIGHSTHPLDAFVALLRRHDVAKLRDVRSTPFSRYNPHFNRESLARSLAASGLEYAWFGAELGGRSDDPSCFKNGRIRYDRLRETQSFRHGLRRLIHDAAGSCVVLMCAEKEPLGCHRALLLAPALQARGVAVAHILGDGGLETHAAAMERLAAMHGDAKQGDLFATDRIERAIERQAERIAYRRATGAPVPGGPGRKP